MSAETLEIIDRMKLFFFQFVLVWCLTGKRKWSLFLSNIAEGYSLTRWYLSHRFFAFLFLLFIIIHYWSKMIWRRIVFILISSSLVDSSVYHILLKNFSDIGTWNRFYRSVLHDSRRHTLTDTVRLPVNLTKIRSRHYDQSYLGNTVGYRSPFRIRIHDSVSSAMKLPVICFVLMDTTLEICRWPLVIFNRYYQLCS